MNRVDYFLRKQAFGVCTRLGEQLGISVGSVRLYFIYASFLTFGSPIVLYLALAFWLNIRRYVRQRRSPLLWD